MDLENQEFFVELAKKVYYSKKWWRNKKDCLSLANTIGGGNMKELARIQVSLLNDRSVLKWRINLIKGNLIFGQMKPV